MYLQRNTNWMNLISERHANLISVILSALAMMPSWLRQKFADLHNLESREFGKTRKNPGKWSYSIPCAIWKMQMYFDVRNILWTNLIYSVFYCDCGYAKFVSTIIFINMYYRNSPIFLLNYWWIIFFFSTNPVEIIMIGHQNFWSINRTKKFWRATGSIFL